MATRALAAWGPMFPQAPIGYSPAPQDCALYSNLQSHGLYLQGAGGTMPQQQQWPGMGYPSQPGQPMPGYPGAPSPNQPMPGFGGVPAPIPAYPSPNPSMPAYGGGAMPVNPPVNVRDNICLLWCLSVNMLLLVKHIITFLSQRGFRGTIVDFPGADPLKDVEVLRKAMKGFGECGGQR